MERLNTPTSNEKSERRKQIFKLLQSLHPDRFPTSSHGNKTIEDAKVMSQMLTNLLSQPPSTTMENAGETITFPIRTRDDRTVSKSIIIPRRSEEFLAELQSSIEDANNPTPQEERPTVDKFRGDLQTLEDADEVMDAFMRLGKLHDSGELKHEYFLPLWAELRAMTVKFLNQDIASCKTKEALASQAERVSEFSEVGLLDAAAIKDLTTQISRAEHYLNEDVLTKKPSLGDWFRRGR